MNAFSKVIRIGSGRYGSIFAKIEFTADGRLSISGVEGPTRDGNARGSCGQIVMSEWDVQTYAPGWDADMVSKFRAIWDRWHLNDMCAGSPDQSAYLRANPPVDDGTGHYVVASAALAAAGLNPDPNYLHNGKPYKYGNAWLREEVPLDVLDWLRALPDTDTVPAWV